MAWDRDRYRREVLEPARQNGNAPPPDLYERYGVRRGISDPAAFTSRVAEVLAYWRELDRRGRYQQLARALLTAHSGLERDGALTLAKFSSHDEMARREQARRLARMAEAEAGSATHAGPATVARLREALSIPVTEAEVAEALSQAGVRVVGAFPELPAGPHQKQPDLAQHVHQLGKRLSAEVVFGDAVRGGFRVLDGFRLADGRALDEATLNEARGRTAALPYADPARAPTENVLAILSTAARRPGDLDALLLSEVIERLRPFATLGFLQRPIAVQARELGLDEDEAGLLAGALLTEETPGRGEVLRAQAAEALDAGRLRAAQRLAGELPAADPLAERITTQDARVAALSREADEELARGQRELAAARLADALEMATDDPALTERLIALPPLPPRNVGATMEGRDVRVTWEASAVLAGRLRYRVMRGQDGALASPSAGTAVSTQTTQNHAVDEGAPPGTDLFYSVFAFYGILADRIGDACSPPAVTGPVVLAVDVTSLHVTAGASSVAASWRPPPGARAILVRRGVGRPPRGAGDGTPVEASLTGFTDTELQIGTEYFYRISVSYQASDGHRHHSPGVVVSAMPSPEPEPVTDLIVTVAGNGVPATVATWTPPRHGEVRLVASDAPPRWPVGSRVTPQEAASFRELPGVPRRGSDARDALELTLPSGRHYIVPLTTGGNTVVVGNAAEAELAEPVRGLVAERMHDCVRLAWEWPRGATEAVIRWADGEHRCSKRVYDDEGGVTVTVGHVETLIEVRAVYPHRGGPLTAPPAAVPVPARGVAVRYRIRRGGMFRRRRRTVELFPERATCLPAIVIVQSTGPYVPDDPADGETLLRIEPQPVTPQRRVRVAVDVRKGPGWLACFTDPAAPDTVLVFHPPAKEMRLP
jgi:hypothetical protein